MPAIPQADINITLYELPYTFRKDEIDGSTSLSKFGFNNPDSWPIGAGGYPESTNQVDYPAYNTQNNPPSETEKNYALSSNAKTGYAITNTGGALAHQLWAFDGSNYLLLSWNPADGSITAKIQTFPGVLDFSDTGMSPIVLSNQQLFSFGGIQPVKFTNGNPGFVLWGVSLVDFNNYLLAIDMNLSPTGYVLDPGPGVTGQPTVTFLAPDGKNYYADGSALPTVNIYTVTFDVTGGLNALVTTLTLAHTGDVSADCANGLYPQGWNVNQSTSYVSTLNGKPAIFGLDYASGNNTGAWYCFLDCSNMGKISFLDKTAAPITPIFSDASWHWTQTPSQRKQFAFRFYPQFDANGIVWWVRPPLDDGGGGYILEASTGKVYSSSPPVKPLVYIDPNTLPRVPFPFCLKAC